MEGGARWRLLLRFARVRVIFCAPELLLMPTPKSKTVASDALVGIWTVALTAFVIAALYFGRELLIPLALAALLTFLLAPFVSRLERWIGRIAAVLLVVAL